MYIKTFSTKSAKEKIKISIQKNMFKQTTITTIFTLYILLIGINCLIVGLSDEDVEVNSKIVAKNELVHVAPWKTLSSLFLQAINGDPTDEKKEPSWDYSNNGETWSTQNLDDCAKSHQSPVHIVYDKATPTYDVINNFKSKVDQNSFNFIIESLPGNIHFKLKPNIKSALDINFGTGD